MFLGFPFFFLSSFFSSFFFQMFAVLIGLFLLLAPVRAREYRLNVWTYHTDDACTSTVEYTMFDSGSGLYSCTKRPCEFVALGLYRKRDCPSTYSGMGIDYLIQASTTTCTGATTIEYSHPLNRCSRSSLSSGSSWFPICTSAGGASNDFVFQSFPNLDCSPDPNNITITLGPNSQTCYLGKTWRLSLGQSGCGNFLPTTTPSSSAPPSLSIGLGVFLLQVILLVL